MTLLAVPALLVGTSDYVYEVHREPTGAMLLPKDVVTARLGGTQGRIVAVAAAGGGIQAAAWTRVLDGLQEAAAAHGDGGRAAFVRRIAVLSGVSGGSVGIAPFVLTLQPPPTAVQELEIAGQLESGPVAAARSASRKYVRASRFRLDELRGNDVRSLPWRELPW